MDTYQPYRASPGAESPQGSVKMESRRNGRETSALPDTYRRRSPGPQDRRGSRIRSRSPPMIDRYQPDPRSRDDHYSSYRDRDDRRRRATPPSNVDRYVPGQSPPRPSVRVNPLPNPLTLYFQVGFTWFAEWWRMNEAIKEDKERQKNGGRRGPERVKGEREVREEREKEKVHIQTAYDAYKEELQVKMARSFVQIHKSEEWFKERYIPDIRDPFRQRLNSFRADVYSQWEHDLDAGVFDEFSLEGMYKNDSNGEGGTIEKEEGEAPAANEVLGVGDLVPLKGANLRDDAVFQPALLIKTIAPTVSRAKIEEFCREHLGDTDGGFKWLSLSDPNPSKKFHRIGWVILNPGSSDSTNIERGDGRDEEMEEGEDGAGKTGNEEHEPLNVATKALEALNGKTIHEEGKADFTCHVGIHAPTGEPRKKALWDLFSAPERIERDLILASRLVSKLEIEGGFSGFAKIEERVDDLRNKGWLQAPSTGPVPVKQGKRSLDGEGSDFDEGEAEEGEEQEEGAFEEEIDDEELLIKKKKLDLLVEYLRRVFNFCFFCVFESDSVHELARKCPGGHLRRPRNSLSNAAKTAAKASATGQPFPFNKRKDSMENAEPMGSPGDEKKRKPPSKNEQQLQRAFNWVKTFEEKMFQILEPESVDLKKLGGKPVEEALEEELSKYVKQEDEAKFRCKAPDCTKLFKAENFWRKHIEKRHTEWFDSIKNDLELVNTYVLDPSRIAPSRSDANSNGHFPVSNSGVAGTPRGFNLAAMSMPFGTPLPGGFPLPGQFPPFFANPGMQPSGTWPGAALFAGDERHQTGPMRRTGNRNNRTGPYDRRPRDSRDARWGTGASRPDGMRGGPGGRPGGRPAGWFDGAPGGGTMGPREAVQGRSLKSYEDLDAVGGGGSGELNY